MTENLVRIRATHSFMDVRQGDESVVPLDATIHGWISGGHVVIVEQLVGEADDGEGEAGPGSAEPDDAGSVED